jgi:hypothetical protein
MWENSINHEKKKLKDDLEIYLFKLLILTYSRIQNQCIFHTTVGAANQITLGQANLITMTDHFGP